MSGKWGLKACLLITLTASSLLAHAQKTALIDELCQSIKDEFVEAVPLYFSGPDPWAELAQLSEACAGHICDSDGLVVASVYYEGIKIRWVVIEMQAPADKWFETTQYFFDEEGLIQKRERLLQNYPAKIEINEDQYFVKGSRIKTNYRHFFLDERRGLTHKGEDWDSFSDPDAPFYTNTADLPRAFLTAEIKHLASYKQVSSVNALSSLLRVALR